MGESRAERVLRHTDLIKIEPPWSASVVAGLNAYQERGLMRPVTCPNKDNGAHVERSGGGIVGSVGALRATFEGWVCSDCDYRQFWADEFMLYVF